MVALLDIVIYSVYAVAISLFDCTLHECKVCVCMTYMRFDVWRVDAWGGCMKKSTVGTPANIFKDTNALLARLLTCTSHPSFYLRVLHRLYHIIPFHNFCHAPSCVHHRPPVPSLFSPCTRMSRIPQTESQTRHKIVFKLLYSTHYHRLLCKACRKIKSLFEKGISASLG